MLSIVFAASLVLLSSVIRAEQWGSSRESSRSRLWGTSFGRPGVNATYDYVIVGGGTAGSTLAARLSQDPRGYSVAVIEAGNFYEFQQGNATQVPGYHGWSADYTKQIPSLISWDFETTPQVGFNGQTAHYAAGRTLGGTTAINTMGYHRGTVGSFKWWADLVGSDEWNWEAVFPYYKRSCSYHQADMSKIGDSFELPDESEAFDADGGPLQISYGNYRMDYTNALARSFDSIGMKKLAGLNTGDLLGYSQMTFTIDPQTTTRDSAETSFLQSALGRANLKVYTSTLAKQILFDDTKKATGVAVTSVGDKGYDAVLSARKEVIVSAGPFKSPQLLMLSGVGPKSVLEPLQIPIVSQLDGVGSNWQDQPYYLLSYKVNASTLTQLNDQREMDAAVEQYLDDQVGILSGVNAGEYIGWEKFPNEYRSRLSQSAQDYLATFPDDWPEIELLPFGNGRPAPGDEVSPNTNYMTFATGILTPKSRGSVSIASTNPFDPPVLDPNYLSESIDEELAVQAIRRTREWAAASGIIVAEAVPGSSVESDDEVLAWVKEVGALVYHATSTCAMGKVEDPKAVIDAHARVFGVSGLRVVDASSPPFLLPGHPMPTVYMLAEKIAEAILKTSEKESSREKSKHKVAHEEL